ncbi:maleate cis-trans isomerase family protein [Jhaorihella thermophila]|uniref:Maleate isomerase n=1 Tax=Jhaorihella thermophila TaxID=488547 RepID=A0A1H5UKP7_9RHOB|nr:Asp/Glu racemase [Jhaorihella thermophila]SEF75595.1 maleate isomerase [Jhaorihella thermophila]
MKLPFDTDAGIGTRATLGVIVLETDETLEPEFARMMALDGVALYHSRIPMAPEVRPDTLARMEADLPAAARLLPSAPAFDVIGYGCTSAATVIGSDAVARAIQEVFSRVRVTDPLAAIIAAGQALGVRRLGFLTPYVPQVSAQMRDRLADAGFEIADFGSFEEGDDRVVARIAPASIDRGARQVAAGAEAVVIACTNLRCLPVIPRIEAATGVPVIASNLALGWHMLRLAGVGDCLPQFGRLFATQLAAD